MGGCCSNNSKDQARPDITTERQPILGEDGTKGKKVPGINTGTPGYDSEADTDAFDSDYKTDDDSFRSSRKGKGSKKPGSPRSPRGTRNTMFGRSVTTRSVSKHKQSTAIQKELASILSDINDTSMILFSDERGNIDDKLRDLKTIVNDFDPTFDAKIQPLIVPLKIISNILTAESEYDNNIFETINALNTPLSELIFLSFEMNNASGFELPNPVLGDFFSDILGVVGGIIGVFLGDNMDNILDDIERDIKKVTKESILNSNDNNTTGEPNDTEEDDMKNGVRVVSSNFKFTGKMQDNLFETYKEAKLWAVRSLRWKNYVKNWSKKNNKKLRDVIKDWQQTINNDSSMNIQVLNSVLDELNSIRNNYIKDDIDWKANDSNNNDVIKDAMYAFDYVLYIYTRLRIIYVNMQFVYQSVLNPWSKKNVMIKNFIESNASMIEKDNQLYIVNNLKLLKYGTYYVTIRSSNLLCKDDSLIQILIEKYLYFLQTYCNLRDKIKHDHESKKKHKDKISNVATKDAIKKIEAAQQLWPTIENNNSLNENNRLDEGKQELRIYYNDTTNGNVKKYLIGESYFHRLSWPVHIGGISEEIPKPGCGLFMNKIEKDKTSDKLEDYYMIRCDDTHGIPGVQYGNLASTDWDELNTGMLRFDNIPEREKTEERKLSAQDKKEYEWKMIPCFEKNSFVLISSLSNGAGFMTLSDLNDKKSKGKEYVMVCTRQPVKLFVENMEPVP